jgi:tetrahedral aminopeptidase
MKALIKKLVEAIGPSGYEDAVREIVRQEIDSLVDEVRVDAMGNLIARRGHKEPNGRRVMLSGHMDEIGIIVTHVDDNGFARFAPLGGVFPIYCLGGRVRFINGVEGVIGAEKPFSRSNVLDLDKMLLDVGATTRENCPIRVGDVAGFERPFLDLGDRLVAKSMDDRIGVAVMIETLRKLESTPHELYFVFSVQEEVGLRGATTSAYGVDPEIGIAVDVTLSGDTPNGIKMEVALGKGPAVKVRDGRMLSDPRLVRLMADTAEAAGLPYQLEVLTGGTTDASVMQLTRAGVIAGCVSIPSRYVHSPSEMVDYNDVQNSVALLLALLSKPIDIQ